MSRRIVARATFVLLLAAGCGHPLAPAERPGAAPAALDAAGDGPARLAVIVQAMPADGEIGELAVAAARQSLGRPYLAHTLDVGPGRAGEPEALVTRLDAFDCVTFVESSLAIARAVKAHHATWEGFRDEVVRLRYRGGRRGDYMQRMQYFSEWILDNAARGHVEPLAPELDGVPDTRHLDFMSTHRERYPLLVDDGLFHELLSTEAHLDHLHRTWVPKRHVAAIVPQLQTGDVVAFTTATPGLDIVHTALVDRLPDGSVHIVHAPDPGMDVQVSDKPLDAYLESHDGQTGVQLARPLPD